MRVAVVQVLGVLYVWEKKQEEEEEDIFKENFRIVYFCLVRCFFT